MCPTLSGPLWAEQTRWKICCHLHVQLVTSNLYGQLGTQQVSGEEDLLGWSQGLGFVLLALRIPVKIAGIPWGCDLDGDGCRDPPCQQQNLREECRVGEIKNCWCGRGTNGWLCCGKQQQQQRGSSNFGLLASRSSDVPPGGPGAD